MTRVLLAALTGKGIKRRRASKDWIKLMINLRLISFLIKMDAKKILKPCQLLFLCVLCVFAVNIYFKIKKPGAISSGFIRLNAKKLLSLEINLPFQAVVGACAQIISIQIITILNLANFRYDKDALCKGDIGLDIPGSNCLFLCP